MGCHLPARYITSTLGPHGRPGATFPRAPPCRLTRGWTWRPPAFKGILISSSAAAGQLHDVRRPPTFVSDFFRVENIYRLKVTLRGVRPASGAVSRFPATRRCSSSIACSRLRWAGRIVTCTSSCTEGSTTERRTENSGSQRLASAALGCRISGDGLGVQAPNERCT